MAVITDGEREGLRALSTRVRNAFALAHTQPSQANARRANAALSDAMALCRVCYRDNVGLYAGLEDRAGRRWRAEVGRYRNEPTPGNAGYANYRRADGAFVMADGRVAEAPATVGPEPHALAAEVMAEVERAVAYAAGHDVARVANHAERVALSTVGLCEDPSQAAPPAGEAYGGTLNAEGFMNRGRVALGWLMCEAAGRDPRQWGGMDRATAERIEGDARALAGTISRLAGGAGCGDS